MGDAPRVVSAPAELLGLPLGFPHPAYDVPGLRLVLVLLGALWVVSLARGRRAAVLVLAVAFASIAFGFWALTLRRPWGLLIDGPATLRLAEIAVAAARGVRGESLVVGEHAVYGVWSLFLEAGVPAAWVSALPTIFPAAVLALVPLTVAGLWRDRDSAFLGASLVVAFGDAPLHAVRGAGLVSGLWARPELSWLFILALATSLLAGRLARGRARRAVPLASVLACVGMASLAPRTAGLPWPDVLLALSLDHGPWLALAGFAFLRSTDWSIAGLVAGGSVSAVASTAAGLDPWLGISVARVGLLLAAAAGMRHVVSRLLPWAGDAPFLPRWSVTGKEPLAVALLFGTLLPASSLLWWSPLDADTVATRSLEPVSPRLDAAMAFVRSRTPTSGVFVASPAYAGAVGALGQRRVLRAEGLLEARDESRRVRAERPLLRRRPLPERFRRWGASHVFAAPGDFLARGVESPEGLADRPGLELLYADVVRFHVYRILPDATGPDQRATAPASAADEEG
jgi:hypothetical protein